VTNSSEVEKALRERRQEAVELERKAEEAARLEQEVNDLRKDLARFYQRHASLAALGDKHLEVPQKSPYPGFGVIEWEPLRSKRTGRELAADVQVNIDHLEGEIASRQNAIKRLLGK
jgi:hypothetical protein